VLPPVDPEPAVVWLKLREDLVVTQVSRRGEEELVAESVRADALVAVAQQSSKTVFEA
jgi:hypothetical protein